MKLHEKHQAPDAEIPYLLDTKDGQFCEGRMRASVAEEIVRSAEARELGGREGFELVVNGRMLFPKQAFVFDDGEQVERGKRSPKRGGRPTEKEPLEEAGETTSNPQLHQAVENAKQEKASEAEKTAE